MVCVPCFIVPVLLFLWRMVVLPIYRRFFAKPVATVDGKEKQPAADPVCPFECQGGVCPIRPKDRASGGDATAATKEEIATEDKKEA